MKIKSILIWVKENKLYLAKEVVIWVFSIAGKLSLFVLYCNVLVLILREIALGDYTPENTRTVVIVGLIATIYVCYLLVFRVDTREAMEK